jgi:hypothetical protein
MIPTTISIVIIGFYILLDLTNILPFCCLDPERARWKWSLRPCPRRRRGRGGRRHLRRNPPASRRIWRGAPGERTWTLCARGHPLDVSKETPVGVPLTRWWCPSLRFSRGAGAQRGRAASGRCGGIFWRGVEPRSDGLRLGYILTQLKEEPVPSVWSVPVGRLLLPLHSSNSSENICY